MATAGQGLLPVLVDQKLNIFRQNGLDLSLINAQSGPAGLASVVSGSVDISPQSTLSLGGAVQQNQKVAFFCGQAPAYSVDLLVSPNSKVPSVSKGATWQSALGALKGQRVGVDAVGSGLQLLLEAAILKAGLDQKSVTYVGTGAGTPAASAFKNGVVDALQSYPFVTQELVGTGQARVAVDLGTDIPILRNNQFSGFVATRSWISTHGAAAVAFCKSYQEGIDALNKPQNRSLVEGILTSTFGLSSAAVVQAAISASSSDLSTSLSPANVDNAFNEAQLVGALPATPKLDFGSTCLKPSE